jgi:predicted RNA-binding Zn ribbon-like protein
MRRLGVYQLPWQAYPPNTRCERVRSQLRLGQDSELYIVKAVALVNSDDRRTGTDTLTTVGALAVFLDAGNGRTGKSGPRGETDAELRAVRRLRARLRAVFDAAAARDRDSVVAGLNRIIADARAVPCLVEHDGKPLHLHYTPPDAPVHCRLGAEMAISLAMVVLDGGVDRLRVCQSPDCGRVLVDLTSNRSRRYCDTQCGNRQHVAAYRARQAR